MVKSFISKFKLSLFSIKTIKKQADKLYFYTEDNFYFYSFKYKSTRQTSSNNLPDFVSELYFNEKGHFLEVFYKTPKNRSTLLAHTGYVLVRVVIVASFLVTFHNICQFYNISFYNSFREIVGRPLYVIYVLILFSFMYFSYRLWSKEYRLKIDNYIIEM